MLHIQEEPEFSNSVQCKPSQSVVEMWVEKLSWPSKSTSRFLAVLVGVSVVDPRCPVMLWSTDGFAGL